ncbi:MAG: FHIPEP family type III secretion protein [Planctomycetaceae bacterium]|nr:FHIPEP family type III secretion protein [Planctomycetaceae bacterium]
MPSEARSGLRAALAHNLNLIVPILIVSAVLVLVVPLPPALLDLLLAANITLSVVILLTTIQVGAPLEFHVFPTLLLGTTLARLVLNVATTRLILANGATEGTEAAGHVVRAFGEFVAAGSATVGLIIFVILVTIQFAVITQGATRIGEVAARFALDGMPGRQMAVDADLANGLLTRDEARAARQQIAQQADFYGAMDGASKFVRGDAVAGLVITCVNIVGGLFIGVFLEGMTVSEATSVFTVLTIGDGLVAQVPAFLISIAAGLLVTRTSVDSDLPADMIGQVFRHPVALYIAAAFVAALAFTGLPAGPLLALAGGCAGIGWILQSARDSEPVVEPATPSVPPMAPAAASEPKATLRIESLELELGIGLIRLADSSAGGDLLAHITELRQQIAQELGFIVPKVRVVDNLRLDPRQFQIKLRGVPVAWGEAYADALLAVDVGGAADSVAGIATIEPSTGRRALWIEPVEREGAIAAGYQVHSPQAFLIQHLGEMVRSHAAELLTRQQVQGLLEDLHARVPQLVDELIPGVLKNSQVQQVLCNLLRERVPIRDLEAILEALGHSAIRTRNTVLLTEYVRAALARTLSQQCRSSDRVLHAVALSDEVEDALVEGLRLDDDELQVYLPQSLHGSILAAVRERLKRLTLAGRPQVVVCRPEIRAGLRQITAQEFPRLHVLGRNEVTADTELALHGTVDIPGETPEPFAFRDQAFRRPESAGSFATGGVR